MVVACGRRSAVAGGPSRGSWDGWSAALLLVLCVLGAGCGGERFAWETATADSSGLEGSGLAPWSRGVLARGTRSLMVIHRDRLVLEAHAGDRTRDTPHYGASLSKGVVGGLALALLLDDRRIELDAASAAWISSWAGDDRRSTITIRQLASHTAGLEAAAEAGVREEALSGWRAAFWANGSDPTPLDVALSDVPLVHPPGRGFAYSSPGYAVLSVILAQAAQKASGQSLPELLRERVFRLMEVDDDAWSIGYGEPSSFEGVPVWPIWGGARFSPDALARVGRLVLHRGQWEGYEVLGHRALEEVLRPVPLPPDAAPPGWPAPAAGWWTNANRAWPELPSDTVLAAGAGHQVLAVVPSLDLVVVRMGATLGEDEWGGDFWEALHRELLRPLARVFSEGAVGSRRAAR